MNLCKVQRRKEMKHRNHMSKRSLALQSTIINFCLLSCLWRVYDYATGGWMKTARFLSVLTWKMKFQSFILNLKNCVFTQWSKRISVKLLYWIVLTYADRDSLCIKISPIFYIANPNLNSAGTSTSQFGNYPWIS